MEKTHTSFKQFLLALTLIAVISMIVYSCKKDQQIISDTDQIANANKWFAATSKTYIPNWDKATVIRKEGINYIILPSNYSIDTKSNKVLSRLVIADSLGIYSAKLIEFINSDLPERTIDIATIYQNGRILRSINSRYNGNVLVLTPDHVFLYGLQLVDGKVTHQLKIMFKNSGIKSLNSRLLMTLQGPPEVPIEPVCTDWYWTVWNGSTGEVVSEVYLYSTCSGGTSTGGGGSSGGDNNHEIIDNVQNPCIKKQLANAINAKTTIGNMLNETFGGTMEFESLNLTFADVTNLPDSISGRARRWSAMSLDFEIQLNKNKLPDYSQEYTLSTIYHEILHAYMFSKLTMGPDGKYNISTQHEDMANKYIILMTGALKIVFPSISDQEAWGLSWGGLEETNLYTTKLTQAQRDLINDINSKHTNKSTNKQGTYCTTP